MHSVCFEPPAVARNQGNSKPNSTALLELVMTSSELGQLRAAYGVPVLHTLADVGIARGFKGAMPMRLLKHQGLMVGIYQVLMK